MLNFSIRTARQSDALNIAKTHINAWQNSYKHIFPESYLKSLSLEKREGYWADIIGDEKKLKYLFVAIVDEQIVGFIYGGLLRDSPFLEKAEIYSLYLDSEYRSQGIGYQLFGKLFSIFKEEEKHEVQVWSLEANTNAHRAYEKWGAKKAADIKDIVFNNTPLKEICHFWVM